MPLRHELSALLRDATLVTLALGLALAWAVVQVAEGVGALVWTFLQEYTRDERRLHVFTDEPLTWFIGERAVTLGPLVRGLVELAVVVGILLVVRAANARTSRA
jgi:hypothetical protein